MSMGRKPISVEPNRITTIKMASAYPFIALESFTVREWLARLPPQGHI